MRELMISIQPKWVEKIVSGEKTVEVRKTKPKCEVPFKCYIYETKGKLKWCNKCKDPCERPYPNCACHEGWGKVIGEFVCDSIIVARCGSYCKIPTKLSQVDALDLMDYADGKTVYGWHITDLVVYDEPRELSEFLLYNVRAYLDEESGLPMPTHEIARPFQSWGYVKAKEPRQTAD